MTTYQHEGVSRQVPPPPSFPPPPPSQAPASPTPDLQVIHDTPQPRAPRPAERRPPGAQKPTRPSDSGLRLADNRGLTGLGAAVVVVIASAVAGAVDGHRAGDGMGWIFGIAFVLCCVAVALAAHTEDMAAVAILPPLAFVVGAIACAAFRPSVAGVPFTAQLRNEVLIAMLIGAPALFVAEALTLVTTGVRGARARVIARSRRAVH